jgi:hypothetical protein
MPETFEAIAKKNKDFAFTKMSMTDSVYTMVNPAGICAACSMAYIKSQRKDRGKTGFNYFGDLSSKTQEMRSETAIRKRMQVIQDLMSPPTASEQIKLINKRLTDNYKMRVTQNQDMANATIAEIYQQTWHKGQGHYLLFMCEKVGRRQKNNHFMAISIGADKCTFYDPNEGELATKSDKFWALLWEIMTQSWIKCYFPNNVTAIRGYY